MTEAEMMEEWEQERLDGMTRDGFIVTDDGGAAWCVKKMREATKERDRMIEWYTDQIERAKAKCDATVARMTAYLQEYADTVPMKDSKTQRTYPIPGGKLVWRKGHTELKHDDAVVLESLKAKGRTEYIKTIEKLDWAGLKKEISATGEMFDGIRLETVPDEFTVQIEKEGE